MANLNGGSSNDEFLKTRKKLERVFGTIGRNWAVTGLYLAVIGFIVLLTSFAIFKDLIIVAPLTLGTCAAVLSWWFLDVQPGEAYFVKERGNETDAVLKSGWWFVHWRGVWFSVQRIDTQEFTASTGPVSGLTKAGPDKTAGEPDRPRVPATISDTKIRWRATGGWRFSHVDPSSVNEGLTGNVISFLRAKVIGDRTDQELLDFHDLTEEELETMSEDLKKQAQRWDIELLEIMPGSVLFSKELLAAWNKVAVEIEDHRAEDIETKHVLEVLDMYAGKILAVAAAENMSVDLLEVYKFATRTYQTQVGVGTTHWMLSDGDIGDFLAGASMQTRTQTRT